MRIRSHVDQITLTQVTGWAINWDQPTTPLEVSVVVNGSEVARCRADIMREKLKTALGGEATGAHEFQWRFDPPLDPHLDHTVEIWMANSHTLLTNGRRMFFGHRRGRAAFMPILITSSGRSGTTMLMQEFAGHPEIAVADSYPFEIKLTSYYAATLNVLSAPIFVPTKVEQEFAVYACQDLITGRNPWNRPPLLRAVGKNHAARLIGQTFPDRLRDLFRSTIEEYYAIIAEESGRGTAAHLFAEKGVLQTAVRQASRAMFGGMKEIVMVRDPRDYICSARRFWKYEVDGLITAMRSELPIIQDIYRDANPDTIFLRYEDLILDPDPTKKTLYDFLGCNVGARDVIRPTTIPESHKTSQSAKQSIGRFRDELEPATLSLCTSTSAGSWTCSATAFSWLLKTN